SANGIGDGSFGHDRARCSPRYFNATDGTQDGRSFQNVVWQFGKSVDGQIGSVGVLSPTVVKFQRPSPMNGDATIAIFVATGLVSDNKTAIKHKARRHHHFCQPSMKPTKQKIGLKISALQRRAPICRSADLPTYRIPFLVPRPV
ncbi:MAG: hypothetical protein ACK40X_13805, partial [Armatimonadota bacterium]